MSAKRKKTGRKTSPKASPNSTAPAPTTAVPRQTEVKLHPCEAAGFNRGLKWGSISVGSTTPIGKSPEPLKHKPELTTPKPSAIRKFAARSPEEKAKFFLLFSKLLTEELENLQGTSEATPKSAPKSNGESDNLPQWGIR